MRTIQYAREDRMETLREEWSLNRTSGRLEVNMEKPVRNAIRSLVDLSWQQRMDLDMEETRRIIILVTVDAAQNCLKNFESVYNKDSRPRDAIVAAIACGNDPSPENMQAARKAAKEAEWSMMYADNPLAALESERSEPYLTQEGNRLQDGPADQVEHMARSAADLASTAAMFASMPASSLTSTVQCSLEQAEDSVRAAMFSGYIWQW